MATTTSKQTRAPELPQPSFGSDAVVLEGVPWAAYELLRDIPENRNVRMSYDDGRLAIESPLYQHERSAGLFGSTKVRIPAMAYRVPSFALSIV